MDFEELKNAIDNGGGLGAVMMPDDFDDEFDILPMVCDGFVPVRAHEDDAGLDLRTPIEVTVPAHGSATIDTKTRFAIPSGWFGKLESKSGLHIRHDIVCLGGTIDASYRGSVLVKLHNFGDEDYTFQPGDKVVQMVIERCACPILTLATDLDDTERGFGGFGSSGR